MKTSKAVNYALSLSAAAILMYFSFREVEWKTFAKDLMGCNWEFIALTLALGISAFFFRSLRWKCLLRPIDPTIDSLTTFNCVNIGYLANFAFPRLGEFVRCGFVNSRSAKRHPDDPENIATFDKTLGTVLMSRSWDVAMVFLLSALLIAGRWRVFGDFFIHRLWAPLGEGFSFSPWYIVAACCIAAIAALLLIPRTGNALTRKIRGFFKGIAKGFVSWGAMPHKWQFFLWTVLLWGTYWMMSLCVIRSMPALEGLGAIDALFVSVAGSLAWMVPVPGGFGAYHYVVALALSSVYALSWDCGIMCATLNHETQAITMILCGLVSYFIETVRK